MSPLTNSPGLTRRSLLQGSAATVLAGIAFSLRKTLAQDIQLEPPTAATPELAALPEPLPIGLTVAGKAAELDYDVHRIFRFVADEVRYEPYAGALRGANGTLWSLSGNSVDKALLLAALLDEALVKYRFAFGELDAAGIDALTAALPTDADQLVQQFTQAQINGFSPEPDDPFSATVSTPASAEDLTDAELQAMDEVIATGTELRNRAAELADQHLAIIGQALADAEIDLPVTSFTLPDSEVSRHTWIQVADGTVWIDHAPALKGIEPGTALPATLQETATDIPDDLVHIVTLRIVAEEYIGGTNARRDAISLSFASTELVDMPVSFMVMPPSSLKNVGQTINQMFTGQATYVPVLLAKDIGYSATVPIVFGAEGAASGVFAAESEGEQALGNGETLALWLAVDIASPGAEPISIERPIYDRIGFEKRQAAAIDFSAIEPVTMVTDPEGQAWVAGLVSARLISVDPAPLPFSFGLRALDRVETFGAMALANPALLALRDGLRVSTEHSQGSHSWISTPQVTVVAVSKTDPGDLESGVNIEIDLLHHAPSTFRLPGAPDELHPAVLAGVTDQVAEQIVIEEAARVGEEAGNVVFGANVGTILGAAVDQGIPIRTLSGPDDLSGVALEVAAQVRVSNALAAGWIVIVPERSVELGGVARSGWWLIDPATGRTRDELDTGKGSASFRFVDSTGMRYGPMSEEGFLDALAARTRQHLGRLGMKIFCGAMFTATALAIGTGFALARAGERGFALLSFGLGTGTAGAAALGGC
jgi:hypothetical protein